MSKEWRRAGFVSLTLGALGCGEPARPAPLSPELLFARDSVGQDSLSGEGWRKFLDARALHRAWAPDPKSPWRPFYKPTLVAAVSIVESAARPIRGAEMPPAEAEARAFAAGADLTDAAVFVDLTGEQSVAWGAVLRQRGLEPVLTINNWPHQFGLLRLERPLGALIFYAAQVSEASLPPAGPPVFILERSRLGQKGLVPPPDRFDNRFFHVPTDFPSALQFTQHGIRRIIYVNPRGVLPGCEEDDLNQYFSELSSSGLQFTYVKPGSGSFEQAAAGPRTRDTVFTRAAVAEYSSDPSYSHGYYHSYSHYSTWHSSYWTRSSGAWGGGGAFSSGGLGSGFSS